jgi:hypothetical protein
MTAYTENGAQAFDSTQDARLDLFFKTVRNVAGVPKVEGNEEFGSTPDRLHSLIQAAWNQDPLDTLKILFNWRDCRSGKGDRHGFIVAMQFIETEYKEWFAINFKHIPQFGRYLDLIHLWHLVSQESQGLIMTYLADQLKQDLNDLKIGKESISLLAKWIPSENSKWDRFKKGERFVISMVRKITGKRNIQSKDLKNFRKSVLVPLRAYIDLVESKMCAKQFDTIKYETVPSAALKRYCRAFHARDGERFTAYLDALKKGETKINASQVFPHELVQHYLNGGSYDEVIEQQWKVWKEKVDAIGAFQNCMAIVDVSGSMSGVPMTVAIALGLLSLNASNGQEVISFSAKPVIHQITSTTLCDQVKSMIRLDWGSHTDIDRVFQMILGMEQRIDRIFIFSDMQFDMAVGGATNFQSARDLFQSRNRELPNIVFWNLRGDTNNFPVRTNDEGALMLSGYSPNLLQSLLENKTLSPLQLMFEIIHHPRYDCIQPYV